MRRNPSQQRPQADMSGTTDSTASAAISQNISSFGIWVAVRVRPFNKKELTEGTPNSGGGGGGDASGVAPPQPVVEVERDAKTMTLLDPTRNFSERANFNFDYCFSAFRPSIVLDTDKTTSAGAGGDDSDDDTEDGSIQATRSQEEIYLSIGKPIVNAAWQGYNSCIFAYGQTSSGKTYTMMGTQRCPGVIPRLARQLFETIEDDMVRRAEADGELTDQGGGAGAGAQPQQASINGTRKITKVTVTYMEIYNEMVRDLLRPRNNDKRPQFKNRWDNNSIQDEYQNLRVRQHPLHGPFVDGITKCEAENWTDCVRLIRQGSDQRSQASTDMNDSSSRSHAIFQLIVTQTEHFGAKVRGKEVTNHKVSKINLVDLAGSERITRTNVTGKHLTEANHINKSLSTLRKVIDVLVSKKKAGSTVVVPYRESLLTWILADNFGGNSKTAMIANISPHHSNFLETESTLRYATLAKGIVNRVRVNEDPSAKLIRELKSQLEQLKTELAYGPQGDRVRELEEQMNENQRAMEELLTREAGMRILIHESRKREEQLYNENEDLRRNEQKWKEEAERLAHQKAELTKTLRKLAQDGKLNESLLSSNKDNFWADDERSADEARQHDTENMRQHDAQGDACPPHQSSLLARRRKSSSAALKPVETQLPPTESSSSATAGPSDQPQQQQPKQEGEGEAAPLPPTHSILDEVLAVESPPKRDAKKKNPAPSKEFQEMYADVPSPRKDPPSTNNSRPASTHNNPNARPTSESPGARFGRRAVTEEGQRPKDNTNNDFNPGGADHGTVRTADHPRGRRRGGDQQPETASVPVSLAHLVPAPGSTSHSVDSNHQQQQTPVGVPQKQQSMAPDALDNFLSGGDASANASPTVRGSAVKPWKQNRKQRAQPVEPEFVQ